MLKQYGFQLRDRRTREAVGEPQWLSTPEARDHVIRQHTSDGEKIIERLERMRLGPDSPDPQGIETPNSALRFKTH
jgi:hypothetical protein